MGESQGRSRISGRGRQYGRFFRGLVVVLSLLVEWQGGAARLAAQEPPASTGAREVEPEQGHDLSLAAALSKQAITLYQAGRYAAAIPLLEQALQIREAVLGPQHPDAALSLNNLAVVLIVQGDYATARTRYERALQIQEAVLGPQHPDVIIILNNLALLDWRLHDLPGARYNLLEASQRLTPHLSRLLSALSVAEQQALLAQRVPVFTSGLLSLCHAAACLPQAYQLVLPWKGLLLEALRRQQAFNHLDQTDPTLAPQVRQLQTVRAQVAGWYHKAGTVPRDTWQPRYDVLAQEQETLERALARAVPPGTVTDPLADLDLRGFQALLAPDEAFLDVYRYTFGEAGQAVEDRYAVGGHKPDR